MTEEGTADRPALGRAEVSSIGGLSMDSSGFGIAPDLDVATVRTRIRTALEALV